MTLAAQLEEITCALVQATAPLTFREPVTHVYRPLEYARGGWDAYLERYANRGVQAVLVGMNPGPFGMAQTGVPFGDTGMVRDWLGIEVPIESPRDEHPKRPVEGFACGRAEVSGQRLWGWARARFGEPEAFFRRFFVANYCPLCFMETSGKNRTPDKLHADERERLFAPCDRALRGFVEAIGPEAVFGIGAFSESRCRAALEGLGVRVHRVLHPSPASPLANQGWAERAEEAFREAGIRLKD